MACPNLQYQQKLSWQVEIKRSKMAFKEICSEICDKLEHLKKFTELQSKGDRIKYCYDICESYFENFDIKRTCKSDEKCKDLRARANYAFYREKQILEGFKLINESVANAVTESELKTSCDDRSDMSFCFKDPVFDALTDEMLHLMIGEDRARPKDLPTELCLYSNGFFYLMLCTIPFYTKKWRQAYSVHCGRQIFSKIDRKIGDEIEVESPYASVLFPDDSYTRCSHCFKMSLSLHPCSKCCFSMLCQNDCEVNHSTVCDMMSILVELKVERMEMLAVRILMQAAEGGKHLEKLCNMFKRYRFTKRRPNIESNTPLYFLFWLIKHTEKRSASDMFCKCVVSASLIHILAKYTEFFKFVPKEKEKFFKTFSVALIWDLLQSLPCNALEITEMTQGGLKEIGLGLYKTFSLYNHSCDPNVVKLSCEHSILLRAIKPIKKGEEIFINYNCHYATHSLSERQDLLMKQYFFKCECHACTQLWPKYEDLPETVKFKEGIDINTYNQLTELFEMNMRKVKDGDYDNSTVKKLEEYLDFLHEFVELPCRRFIDCQEALKHCWYFDGNYCTMTKEMKY